MDNQIRIVVSHPRTSETFEADVSPACPARTVLAGLQREDSGPFLVPAPEGRPYALVLARTGRQLTPNTSMTEGGVVDGDHMEVQQIGQGA
ncbi:MAG: hypothetical protein ACRD0Q_00655 [Acidimicrobiales bacterium]